MKGTRLYVVIPSCHFGESPLVLEFECVKQGWFMWAQIHHRRSSDYFHQYCTWMNGSSERWMERGG